MDNAFRSPVSYHRWAIQLLLPPSMLQQLLTGSAVDPPFTVAPASLTVRVLSNLITPRCSD